MKAKEMDCFVLCKKDKTLNSQNILVALNQSDVDDFLEHGDIKYRAKLIIEIPEKKIEITESSIDEAIEKCFHDYGIEHDDYINFIKALGFTE